MRVQGTCHVLLAFDLGFAVDLDRADARIRDPKLREQFANPRRAPEAARPRSRHPLRVAQSGPRVAVDSLHTDEQVRVMIYEFAAAVVAYRIPIAGDLDELVGLASTLWDHPGLIADGTRRMTGLLAALGDAVVRPELSPLIEDYVVFEVRPGEPVADVAALVAAHAPTVARLLRAEPGPLSAEEIADALAQRVAYRPDELLLIDWSAALLIGTDLVDERTVLQLGLVELLQLRVLDGQLDRTLDEAYLAVTRVRPWWGRLRVPRVELERLSVLAADATVLFEAASSGMKLLGDQYLARLYRSVSARFHLDEWERGVERKLAGVGAIFAKLESQASGRRFELLEIVIIVLIAMSMVLPFVGLAAH
ncbi:MAG TPA: hypothetical protein VM734_00055 [Kofleriaceae bacterium]|jgi:hypothetical protein|nr:hypothetical protein [Kofleriaceae bacterium]